MSLQKIETRPTPADCRADSRLDVWEAAGKRFFVLAQKGRFADICFDHGRLLGAEMEDGVFPEILATVAHDVDASRSTEIGVMDRLLGAFFNRLSKDLLRSSSDEFRRGVEALGRGYFAGLPDPLFNDSAVEHACVAIDTGNIATGFDRIQALRKLSRWFSYWLNYALEARVREDWGRVYGDAAAAGIHDDVPLSVWLDFARRAGGMRRAGMGCTGFWAAPGLTDNGLGLHARNFDGAFFAWNRHPVLNLIDETPENPVWQRYAAVGTAGLVYPGGISGMNEAGIAVSLHQMSTVNFSVGDGSGDFDVAPYVQQRILREARTLDEAVDIVRGRKHFASWTILVSHAPSGQALRIELNGYDDRGRQQVQRVEPGPRSDRMIQTNHFLSEALKERNDFFADAHFTKTVGKWMETRARFKTAEAQLAEAVGNGGIGTERALEMMAGHADGFLEGAQRSFGRTACKAYSLMSSIARASADRASPADELWFTIGERLPGPHSTLVGFRIDWANLSAAPAGTQTAATVSSEMLAAMEHYIDAFAAYERPRQPDGGYFRRKPTEREMQHIRRVALADLDRAVTTAEDAGIADPVFRYIRARLCHEAAVAAPAAERADLLARAARDWHRLREQADDAAVPMTDWERALIFILSAATEAAREDNAELAPEALLEKGRTYLEQVADSLFDGGRVHQDIKNWCKVAAAIDADGPDAELPGIDFVTVE